MKEKKKKEKKKKRKTKEKLEREWINTIEREEESARKTEEGKGRE